MSIVEDEDICANAFTCGLDPHDALPMVKMQMLHNYLDHPK